MKEKLDSVYDEINIFEDKAFCKELEVLRENIKPELKFVLSEIKVNTFQSEKGKVEEEKK